MKSKPNQNIYYTSALATLGADVIMTSIGYLILNPYKKSYRISGTCKTPNESYLRNKNGTYFFSLATGVGVSYGGSQINNGQTFHL